MKNSSKFKGIKYFIHKIKTEDKLPFVFIDVGAMGGMPLKWKELMPAMQVIGFEPNPDEFVKLKQDNNKKYLDCALGEQSADLKYYLTRESDKSSNFKPDLRLLSAYADIERFQVVKEENIPAARVKNLDSLLKENHIQDADFIKLDTNGSELSILKGGQKDLLPRVFGAQIEAEFIKIYEGQPLFRDLDAFMQDNGFQLVDLRRNYWKHRDYCDYCGRGQLIFADVLYFRKDDSLFRQLPSLPDKSAARAKIFKSILTCLIYKIFDYAASIAGTAKERGYLDEGEFERVIAEIKNNASGGIPLWLHLNTRVYNFFNSVLGMLKPRSYLGWGDSDREIGNIKDR